MPLVFDNVNEEITASETNGDVGIAPRTSGSIAVNSDIINHRQLLRVVANQQANYNAAAGDLVLCNTNAIGSFTVTLPASPQADDRIGVKLQTHSPGGQRTVTIARNGKTIDGAAVNFVLYWAGDYVELQYDGSSDWVIVYEHIMPHYGVMQAQTTQTSVGNPAVQIVFNNAVVSVAEIANVNTDEFIIRRAGWYICYYNGVLVDVDAATVVIFQFRRNVGSPGVFETNHHHVGANPTHPGTWGSAMAQLTVGETVELWMRQNAGVSELTSTSDGVKPYFAIREIRKR